MGRLRDGDGRLMDEAFQPLVSVGSINTVDEIPRQQKFQGGKAGFWACVFNLANAAMGAGVLAFPYAFKQAGYMLGAGFAIGGALLFGLTLNVVGLASDRAFAMAATGHAILTDGSYQEVTAAVLGPKAGKAMTWCLATYLTVSNIAFLVIMFDQAQPVLRDKLGDDSPFVNKRVLVPIFTWVIGFPLAMIPNMELFSIPSTVSQFGIFYAVGVVSYYGYGSIHKNQISPGYDHLVPAHFTLDAVTAIPLICFSFQCHVTFPLVYASMKGKSLPRMKVVNLVCMLGCLMVYLVIGFAGYMMLGHSTPDDILTGICGDSGYFDINVGDKGCCLVNSTVHGNSTGIDYSDAMMAPGAGGLGGYYHDRHEPVLWTYGRRDTTHGGRVPSNDPLAGAVPSGHACSSAVLGAIAIARFCVLVKVSCSFGMIVFVTRNCIQTIVMPAGKQFTRGQHLLTTIIYTVGLMLGAMFCPGLSIALSLAGILVVVIDLIFPGFMLIAITKSVRGKAAGWALVGIGTVIGVISTYTTVTAIISDVKNHKF